MSFYNHVFKIVPLLIMSDVIMLFNCSADTLKGEFEFLKKAPKTGLIYFSQDDELSTDQKPVIDQIDKKFTTNLAVGRKGTGIIFKNSDSIDHNIYANDLEAKIDFDAGLIEPGNEEVLPMDWEPGTIVRIGCKIHPRMRSYIANITSRFYQILPFQKGQTNYKVEIKNIPRELKDIVVWMPRYEAIELPLEPGNTIEIEVKKKGKVYGTLTLTRIEDSVAGSQQESSADTNVAGQ